LQIEHTLKQNISD